MPSIYDLKPRFQALLRPMAGRLAARGVTANEVTVAAVALSAVAGAAEAAWPAARLPWLLLPVVLFARMALNAVDGMLAREHGMKTRLGAVLNELGDVFSDIFLYLPLALVPGVPPFLAGLVVALAVATETAGIVGVQIGASRRYDGPMGKSDRAFAYGVIGFLLGMGVAPGAWLSLVLWLVAALLALTVWNRAARALREARP
jgi:CDP-diacylglycerol---glycerol-3-phosphate 3-phosphatidyltransferase